MYTSINIKPIQIINTDKDFCLWLTLLYSSVEPHFLSETVNGKWQQNSFYFISTKVSTLFQGNVPVVTTETDPLQYILLGIVAGLVIALVVLTTTLLCTRKTYEEILSLCVDVMC